MTIKTKLMRRLLICILCSMLITIFIVTAFACQTEQNETIHKSATQDEISTTISVVVEETTKEMLKSTSPTETISKMSETINIPETTVIEEKAEKSPNAVEQFKPITVKPTEPVKESIKPDTTVPKPTDPTEITPTYPQTDSSGIVNLGMFTLTAYCPCYQCCGKWSEFGLTATGTVPAQGRTIAVDPDVIPYGTQVIINGNTYVAEDCGGAIQGNKIDIFFNNHDDALIFGIQTAEVKIIKNI